MASSRFRTALALALTFAFHFVFPFDVLASSICRKSDQATYCDPNWKSVKYEEVYLKAYNTLDEARRGLGAYFDFYNQRRHHQGLDNRVPDDVYWASRPTNQAAA